MSRHRSKKKKDDHDNFIAAKVAELSDLTNKHSKGSLFSTLFSQKGNNIFSLIKVAVFLLTISVTAGSMLGSIYYKNKVLGASSKSKAEIKETTSEMSKLPEQESFSPFALEIYRDDIQYPTLEASSALVASTEHKRIFYTKNPDQKLPPASTTKILTALLAIDEFNLGDYVSVPESCTKVEGTKLGLLADEQISVESLLYGILVASAGDAACTLSSHDLSQQVFIEKMNKLAKDIGVSNTNFTNVIGLDSLEGEHVSTARDLYLMSSAAMKNGVFRKIVGTKEEVLYSKNQKIAHPIKSTNKLLFEVPGALGVKTGKTDQAKEVLVFSYQHKGDEIITVVMGSNDRFGETKKLIDFVELNYSVFFENN